MRRARKHPLDPAVVTAAVFLLALPAGAGKLGGVLTPQARQQTLLEYVAGRDDLSREEKARWDRALRLTFGGKAIQDGTDEGVTVAKSVISAAIFHGIEPDPAAKAAYEAYHDTYRWIPPPVAINYQILKLLGRKPQATAWEMSYHFPEHYNEEIAPELAGWWADMLAQGKIPDSEVADVKEALAATRKKMRPSLLEVLQQAADLESQLSEVSRREGAKSALAKDLRQVLEQILDEVDGEYRGVASAKVVYDRKASAYDRLAAFSREMGRPVPVEPKARPAPTPTPTPTPTPEPETETEAPRGGAATATTPARTGGDPVLIPAPGDPLVKPPPGWEKRLDAVVKEWVGVPYLWGGQTKKGVDCSAFVRNVLSETVNVFTPPARRLQYLGREVERRDLQVGDMIFFDTLDRGRITHVGLYIGNGKMAHAASKGVAIVELKQKYYTRTYRLARSFLAR